MKLVKTLAVAITAVLTALIVIPLVALAGLFIWLKLTEENDDDLLDLDLEDAG